MKRKSIAVLIAATIATEMIFSQFAPVYAINNKIDDVSVASSENKSRGTVEINFKFDIPIKSNSVDITKLVLKLKRGNEEVITIPLGNNKANSSNGDITYETKTLGYSLDEISEGDVYYYNTLIENIPVGVYTLEVNGEGFAPITLKENIEVKSYSKRIYISNDRPVALTVDVDGDSKTTKNDYDLVLNNIGTNNTLYDFNRDGLVDITDLAYVNESITKEVIKDVSIVDTKAIVDTSKVNIVEAESKGNIIGEVASIFNDSEKGITLEPDKNSEAQVSIALPNIRSEQVSLDVKGIAAGQVLVETDNGQVIVHNIGESFAVEARSVKAKESEKVVINLGKQVAVKKITIKVSATDPTNNNLAEIGKVEFVNDIYKEIPKVENTAPTITEVETSDSEIKLKWTNQVNIDGYEVCYKSPNGKDTTEKIAKSGTNSIALKEVENFTEYEVKVRSYSGDDWKGDWSEVVKATPAPKKAPDAPENIIITGDYKSLNISWKSMKGAEGYNLFYRKKGESDYKKVEKITGTSYQLFNLEDEVEYEIYLTSYNAFGESGKSKVYLGATVSLKGPTITEYNLINRPKENFKAGESPTEGIVNVEYPNYSNKEHPNGVEKFAVVDNDYTTSWTSTTWNTSHGTGPLVTFDKEYTMDTVRLVTRLDNGYGGAAYDYVPIRYYDSETNNFVNMNGRYIQKTSNGKIYYEIKFPKPITTNKIQVCLRIHPAYVPLSSISEVKFYKYDSIEDDVRNLFTDDLLIDIKDDVTQEKINNLRERANTKDSVSGEYHPNQNIILEEIQLAEDILNDKNIDKNILTVNQNINNCGNNLGLKNDYQSLGYTAKAGDEIVVYVGTEGNILPELAFTQHYAESGKFIKTIKLNKGKNVIEVPEISNLDVEKGGAIYVRYPSASPSNNPIKIRISGAKKIPHLNVYGKINDSSKESEVKEEIRQYIRELKDHVETMKDEYPKIFTNKSNNEYRYDDATSILNATDIEGDKVTLNMPAKAILEGITTGLSSEDEEVDRLYNSLLAWEQLLDLKYAERGVAEISDSDKRHSIPKSRLHVKYQRMFAGAFMYASSHHVGVEYGSVAALVKGVPYTFNEDGTVKDSGQLFGWGIAHELGHVTEIPGIAKAEVTNNIIALLAQTLDDKSKSRLENDGRYDDVYRKVTSETVGLPGNVFVQLAMFWQLHLAYDENPTALMLRTDRDNDHNNDSFYARLSKIAREATNEDKGENMEQNLIRFASDAAKKDLRDFFNKWGVIADSSTLEYLDSKGYEKETRDIQYLNDEARRKKLEGVEAMASDTKVKASLEYDDSTKSKKVELTLGTDKDSDKILGYEIYRNGKVIGFTTEASYNDYVSVNNRVLTYEVVAYDYNLNRTEKVTLNPIKISHDGSLTKTSWSINSNMKSLEDVNDENNTTGPVSNPSIEKIKDYDNSTIYKGLKETNENPYLIVELEEMQNIVGFKYTAGVEEGKLSEDTIKDYEVYVSKDKETWTLANKGQLNVSVDKPEEVIYFNKEGSSGGKQLWAYDTAYVKIVAPRAKGISMAELDIIAPPGDNIDLKNNGIGKLSEDFVYGKNPEDLIPKGSIVFTGEYRGNPVFNAILLRDRDNNVLSGEQLLFAEIPENGDLGEISSGTWIFFITPENYKEIGQLPNDIRAELYRVNDAETSEGQRLVSDTLYVDIPEELPEMSIDGGIIPENMKTN
ncbi:M60 family metallopeptidase [Clostridium septicum]|uniref:M60 family metallopeptidase n=1 Tax=Clostridium septicum TaxID=1504 RepID=UPI000836B286|nr:M60 family metallopeptidase [Clostridium septicum]